MATLSQTKSGAKVQKFSHIRKRARAFFKKIVISKSQYVKAIKRIGYLFLTFCYLKIIFANIL